MHSGEYLSLGSTIRTSFWNFTMMWICPKLLVLQAKKFYESALRLEPGYLGAALALAELHVMEGRTGDAISLLERYLKDWADDSLHVKLAQVFAATNMLQDALSHYQSALRLNLIQDVFQFSGLLNMCNPCLSFSFWPESNAICYHAFNRKLKTEY